jgi:glutamate racemase
VLFVADQAHVPYGGRPLAEVAGFARGISDALISQVDSIVMACNISTATALDSVSARYQNSPIFGVVAPGARAAIDFTTSRSIGVLATHGTVQSGAYTRALKGLIKDVLVTEVACPDFVPLIESEKTDSVEALNAANKYLAPILHSGADAVILGCTHYPFLLPTLRKAAPHLHFVDPAEQTVCELSRILTIRNSKPFSTVQPVHRFYTTGDPRVFEQQVGFFMPALSPGFVLKQANWCGGRLCLE